MLRLGSSIASEEVDGRVYVARLPDGPILVLDDTAAVIWAEAYGRDRSGVVRRVADRLGAEATDIAADVGTFIDDLIARGVLVESR